MSRNFTLSVLAAGLLAAAGSAQAYQAGDILVRAGAVLVDPQDSSNAVTLGGNGVGDGNWKVSVDSNTQLGLNLSYLITDHIAVGLLAATPFRHNISAAGSIAGAGKLGETKHLPPTLTLQYYPMHASHKWQPYVGLGINYTTFFEEKTSDTLTGAVDAALGGGVASTGLRLDDSFGVAAEFGMDYRLSDRFALNAAIWWADIDTTAKIDAYDAGGNRLGTAEVDVDIDPLVYMVGFSYRF